MWTLNPVLYGTLLAQVMIDSRLTYPALLTKQWLYTEIIYSNSHYFNKIISVV